MPTTLHSLPTAIHKNILEQLDFESLPAAIAVIAQACTAEKIALAQSGIAVERSKIFRTHSQQLWLQVMAQHLEPSLLNRKESKFAAMVRIARYNFAFRSNSPSREPTPIQAAYLLHALGKKLEQGLQHDFYANPWNAHSDLDELRFVLKPFSRQCPFILKRRLLLMATIGSHALLYSLLSQAPAEDKVNCLREALKLAVSHGHVETVQLLINMGAKVERQDLLIALEASYAACKEGYPAIVRLLIEKNADVNAAGEWAKTPLHRACAKGYGDIVRLLLENGANVNAADEYGRTSLHHACAKGHIDSVHLLFENVANVNDQSRTLLSDDSARAYGDIVRLLIANNANVNAADKQGVRPLHYACERGHDDIVPLLLDNGANVHVTNENGTTPLHYPCEKGHRGIVLLLLKKGANVNAQNNQGKTPLDKAYRKGHKDILALLVSHSKNANATADQRMTPLHNGVRQNSR